MKTPDRVRDVEENLSYIYSRKNENNFKIKI